MRSHVARLYALTGAVFALFLAWLGIATHPWQQARAKADPHLVALERREKALRRESIAVKRTLARRWSLYRAQLAVRQQAIRAAEAAHERELTAAREAQARVEERLVAIRRAQAGATVPAQATRTTQPATAPISAPASARPGAAQAAPAPRVVTLPPEVKIVQLPPLTTTRTS